MIRWQSVTSAVRWQDVSATIRLQSISSLAGPKGDKGDPGGVPDFEIGTVTTLEAGEPATASITGTAQNPTLNLGIPEGEKGEGGEPGDAASITIGTVTTVESGEPATVTNVGTSSAAILDFEIPKGEDGAGSGDVEAASNIPDGAIVVGDGGGKGVKGHASGAPGDAAFKNTGTSAGTVAAGDHNHSGVYEPADGTILKSAAIGSTIQAHSARLGDVAGATYARGDILIFNGTNLVKLAAGADGKVLTTHGTSADPTWETPAGGGGGQYVLISKQVASNSANLSWTGLDTANYDSFELVFENIVPVNNNIGLYVQVGTGATPTWQTSGYVNAGATVTAGIIFVTDATGGTQATVGNTANRGASGNFNIGNLASSTYKQSRSSIMVYNSTPIPAVSAGYYDATTAITAIRLIFATGNISTGIASLYGRKNS